MLVISDSALLQLQSQIIAATHGLCTVNGGRASISTINEKTLKQAAIIAVQIASGEVVLPNNDIVVIDVPTQQQYGPFRIGRT